MVDGRTLIEKDQRLSAIHRASVLIDRIAALFSPETPAVRLVVTHFDLGKPTDETLQELRDNAAGYGIDLSISNIASFSKNRGNNRWGRYRRSYSSDGCGAYC